MPHCMTEETTILARHLIDPQLLDLADRFPPIELSDESLPTIRAMFEWILTPQELPDLH